MAASASIASASSPLVVQYVAVRKDLLKTLKWTIGSVMTQACHASAAAIWTFKDNPTTQEYLSEENMGRMNKVVVEVPDDGELLRLRDALESAKIDHKLWMELPESIPTALATRPYVKTEVNDFFKGYKLYR